MKTIGRPPGQRPDAGWTAAQAIGGLLLWLLIVLIEVAAVIAVVWLIVQYGIPWIIDVIMDAIESREP